MGLMFKQESGAQACVPAAVTVWSVSTRHIICACTLCFVRFRHSQMYSCCLGAVGCFCPLALSCYTANKYGENCCLGCVPGGLAAMRTHMRLTYGIQGTICNDALMTFFCGHCEVCRMAREIRIRNGEISQ
uniref:Cornifelin n=1 Tax=Neolamprologus brichardi TaxID=32507 RepID=A0A3Q4H866_NEOBR